MTQQLLQAVFAGVRATALASEMSRPNCTRFGEYIHLSSTL